MRETIIETIIIDILPVLWLLTQLLLFDDLLLLKNLLQWGPYSYYGQLLDYSAQLKVLVLTQWQLYYWSIGRIVVRYWLTIDWFDDLTNEEGWRQLDYHSPVVPIDPPFPDLIVPVPVDPVEGSCYCGQLVGLTLQWITHNDVDLDRTVTLFNGRSYNDEDYCDIIEGWRYCVIPEGPYWYLLIEGPLP